MKAFLVLLTTLSLSSAFAVNTVAARGLDIKSLSCSGLGLANGYTTLQYVGDGQVTITSVKYFITTSDVAKVVASRTERSGDLTLQFVTKNHGSSFLLKLYSGTLRGDLITAGGTDVLTCSSTVSVN